LILIIRKGSDCIKHSCRRVEQNKKDKEYLKYSRRANQRIFYENKRTLELLERKVEKVWREEELKIYRELKERRSLTMTDEERAEAQKRRAKRKQRELELLREQGRKRTRTAIVSAVFVVFIIAFIAVKNLVF
jgi:hypothetical protein